MAVISLITLVSFVLNIPFGYMRSRAEKYSLKWFLYIHIPVPMVILARVTLHADYRFIPLFILAAVAGQFCGGRLAFNS
jgi:hypothetical protein